MPSSLESSSPFPAVRRIVTGHTVDGKSTVLADTVLPPRFWTPESIAPTYDIHYTGESPANNDSEIRAGGKWVDEVAEQKDLVSKDGATFRSWDFAPGSVTPFHRTISVDYGIVAKGSVILELDDGERVSLTEGDTVVQRGTIHTWRNESTEWAKMYFIMLGAKPIEVNGKQLEEEFRPAK
ncbi:hypothetical protein C8J57DRAFT_1338937 [Mycena rebaudengoi]|nr:hypothetical protein C8J57DRAFT_1338937 [Mycena rebaudengoi]